MQGEGGDGQFVSVGARTWETGIAAPLTLPSGVLKFEPRVRFKPEHVGPGLQSQAAGRWRDDDVQGTAH